MSEFSEKWKRWAEVSCSKPVMDHIKREFIEMFGYKEFPITDAVYDAGCGLGRYSQFVSGLYAGIDLSNSVDIAVERYGSNRCEFIHGDMCDPRVIKPYYFDLVIAVGTLHHTENTEKAFKAVAKYVRPGGTFCLSIYAKKHPIREAVDDAIRSVTTKMSEEELVEFSQMITDVGWTLRKEDEELQEWFYYNVLKCYYNLGLGNDFSASVNYDWLKPEFAWRHEADEIRAWAAASNFSVRSLKSTGSAHWARLVKE